MAVAGLSLLIAAAVLVLRVETASPGTPETAPQSGVPSARGALGYRVPLVVKQRVPARIIGGVYMPAHETYVVLRPGYWELAAAPEEQPKARVPNVAAQPASDCRLGRRFWEPGRCDGGP